MEVEESEVRKSKGRASRSNSNSSKDLRVEKANMKETNGDSGESISDLPNGNEGPPVNMIKTEDDSFETEEHPIEEDASGNIGPVTKTSPVTGRVEPSEEDCNSHSNSKNVVSEGVTIKMEVDTPDSPDGEDFRGFSSQEAKDHPEHSTVLARLCEKSEKYIAAYEVAFAEYQRREAFRSGTSSPMKIDGLTEVMGGDGDLCSSNASSPSVASGFSGELKGFKGKKSLHIDLSSPAFRKPLDMGWRRELVFRNMPDATQKRMADVYYYTPNGKKVRSAREVLEHLPGTDLTDENFTFFKMALGLNDPKKEVIRDAKRGFVKEPSGTPPPKIPKIAKSPKPDGIKVGTPPNDSVGTPKSKNFARGSFPRIKVSVTKPGAQVSPVRTKTPGRAKKDTVPLAEGELEMGMLPPSWKEPTAVSGAHKPTPPAAPIGHWSGTPAKEDGMASMGPERVFMHYFMQNVCAGYSALRHAFQFLKVHELLRAGRVCRMWHDLAGHPSLWKTVRMKNSQVLDWGGCAAALSRHGTQHLDLRKMLLDQNKSKEMWTQFCEAIGRIPSLRHLDLCRCPASVVERVATQCPQLTNLVALFIADSNIDLNTLGSLSVVEELRLKGTSGLKLKSSLEVLTTMTTLRHLSLTTIKELGKSNPEILQSLTQLESLELGECSDFSEAFGTECLPRLTCLTRLRLEMGQGKCPTFVILSGVKSLPVLTHLELVNFDIKPGFDQALAQCTNIKRLLLIPTYLTQSATTNHMVLGGVTKLSKSLTQFVWGVTHELLHVTELFKDQCEGQKGGTPKATPNPGTAMNPPPTTGKKNSPGDSIPILRPVPGMEGLGPASEIKTEENESPKPSPQVDILPLLQIQKILISQLPQTKVSILKIPFHATWRQTLADH